jgi:hypothetical protein
MGQVRRQVETGEPIVLEVKRNQIREVWPSGFCGASRITALRPGSGIETSCASVEDTRVVKLKRVRTSGRIL